MYKDSLWGQAYNNSVMPGGRGGVGGNGSMSMMMGMNNNGMGMGGGLGSTSTPAPNPCKYFMSGGCLKGDSCPFSHEIPDERHLDIEGLGFVFNTNVVVHNPRAAQQQATTPITQPNIGGPQQNNLPSLSGSVSGGAQQQQQQPQQSPVQAYPLSTANTLNSNSATFSHMGANNNGSNPPSALRGLSQQNNNASPTTGGGGGVMSPTALSFNINGNNTQQQQQLQQQQQSAQQMIHHRNSSNSTPLSNMNGNNGIAQLLASSNPNGDSTSIHSSPAPSIINNSSNNNTKVLMPAHATSMNALQSLAFGNNNGGSNMNHPFLTTQSPTGQFAPNQQQQNGSHGFIGGVGGIPQNNGNLNGMGQNQQMRQPQQLQQQQQIQHQQQQPQTLNNNNNNNMTNGQMPPLMAGMLAGRGKRMSKYRPCDQTFPHSLPPFLQGAFENLNSSNSGMGGQQAATVKTLHDIFRIPLPIDAPYPHIISVAVNSPSAPNGLNVANVSSNAAAAAAASNRSGNNNSNGGGGVWAGGAPPPQMQINTQQRPLISPYAFSGEYAQLSQQQNSGSFRQSSQSSFQPPQPLSGNNNNNNANNINSNNNNTNNNASSSSHSGHSTPAPAPMAASLPSNFNTSASLSGGGVVGAQTLSYPSGTNPFVKA